MLHQLVAEQPHWAARGEYLSRLLCLNPPKLSIIIIGTFFFFASVHSEMAETPIFHTSSS